MFSTESSQMCQSRYFKEWHPDYIGSYNSINDPHLKGFFRHPARRSHLSRGRQVMIMHFLIVHCIAIKFHKSRNRVGVVARL